MKARAIDAVAVTSLASVCIVVAGTAWAAPSVSIIDGGTIGIGPAPPLEVCLDANVRGATSVLWTKAPFTAVGVAYDPNAFPVFEKRFGRPFHPSDPENGLIPSGPGAVGDRSPRGCKNLASCKSNCLAQSCKLISVTRNGSVPPGLWIHTFTIYGSPADSISLSGGDCTTPPDLAH